MTVFSGLVEIEVNIEIKWFLVGKLFNLSLNPTRLYVRTKSFKFLNVDCLICLWCSVSSSSITRRIIPLNVFV